MNFLQNQSNNNEYYSTQVFVDASENFNDTCCQLNYDLTLKNDLEKEKQQQQQDLEEDAEAVRKGREETEKELKVRLEEVTVILRMALNNEFVKALEICGRR